MLQRILPTLIPIAVFFVLLFAYTKIAGPIPFSISSVTTTKNETFNVSGEGKVSIKPDIALVTVGVLANGSSVKAAQDQMNIAINKVTQAIKGVGVAEKDIQTTNYSINPTYDYTSGNQRITGYQANTNLSIKVRNIDNINKVIDEATKNGANQVGGINFEVEDKTDLQNQAREKAVTDAKEKAQQAAKIAGFKLGRIVNYNENFGDVSKPIIPFRSSGAMLDEKAQTSIETGSSEIIVNVTLSYEIY